MREVQIESIIILISVKRKTKVISYSVNATRQQDDNAGFVLKVLSIVIARIECEFELNFINFFSFSYRWKRVWELGTNVMSFIKRMLSYYPTEYVALLSHDPFYHIMRVDQNEINLLFCVTQIKSFLMISVLFQLRWFVWIYHHSNIWIIELTDRITRKTKPKLTIHFVMMQEKTIYSMSLRQRMLSTGP